MLEVIVTSFLSRYEVFLFETLMVLLKNKLFEIEMGHIEW